WEDVKSLECNASANTTCFGKGTDIINYYGFSKSHYNRNLGLLFAIFGTCTLLSLLILTLRAKFQRKTG
ncbi:unnamed protein product, partial [Adineta steineri]